LPSGKIDRMALPSPSSEALAKRRSIVHGRTEIEKGLISIWREVLKFDQISIDDNFFDLGGHSLSGMRVLARIRRDFHIDVPIRSLFDRPTIEGLALEVEKQKGKGAQIAPVAAGAQDTTALLNILRAELSALSPEQVDAFLQSVLADKDAKSGDKN
jgi:acyl carrier protein